MRFVRISVLVALSLLSLTAQSASSPIDASPHRVQFVRVNGDVRLEVLDWGGSGRPLVLLSGYGDTAHVFDLIAPKLSDTYHVYGVTRRGFGASDSPASGYSVDALAGDLLDVFDVMRLNKPVLVGHSIAGEEMTALASGHPDRIGALVYLDAAYDRSATRDLPLEQKIEMSKRYGKTASIWLEIKESTPKPDYAHVQAPALAMFAGWPFPDDIEKIQDEPRRREAEKRYMERRQATIQEFQRSMPRAHVIDLSNSDHYMFLSHEADVLRETRAFLAALP